MIAISFILALFGFAVLALAMRRHHRDVLGGVPTPWRRGVFRVLGAFALVVSYAVLCIGSGAVEATIEWLCLVSLPAIILAAALGEAPRLGSFATRNAAGNAKDVEAVIQPRDEVPSMKSDAE